MMMVELRGEGQSFLRNVATNRGASFYTLNLEDELTDHHCSVHNSAGPAGRHGLPKKAGR